MSLLKSSQARLRICAFVLPVIKRRSPAICQKLSINHISYSNLNLQVSRLWIQTHDYHCLQPSGNLKWTEFNLHVPSKTLKTYRSSDSCKLFTGHLERIAGSVGRLQCRGMAGHSHWANIKHSKARSDAKKSLLHTRLTLKIKRTIIEHGSSDPKHNKELAKVITEAKVLSVPNDVIENAIKRSSTSFGSMLFEGRGPGGSLFLMEINVLSRDGLSKRLNSFIEKNLQGASLEQNGSVRSYFNHQGVINALPNEEGEIDMDKYLEVALEAGAEEMTEQKDDQGNTFLEFTCDPSELQQVKSHLEKNGMNVWYAESVYTPMSTVKLDDQSLNDYKKLLQKLSASTQYFQLENITTNIEDFDPGLDD